MKLKSIIAILCLLLMGETFASPRSFKNPILPGFHPDPSICRVGEDYYLVTSSFEWFPGVPIYRSRDLVNWEQIGNVLTRPSQLMMGDSLEHNKGIYAPTLRHHDGKFYMITTCVAAGGNFLVTADDPAGPWSDPVWIKDANGIDPSLFWDEDGSCWYSGAGRLSAPNWSKENRIYVAKIDTETGEFLTPKREVCNGHADNAQNAEGAHIYKFDDKYLMMVAEGGTGKWHSITVHQSDSVDGDYVSAMINPVMTHRHLGKSHPINTIGHADLVQTQSGDWWGVCLGKRIYDGHLLARETFLTPVSIEDGLPIFNPGVGRVLAEDERPDLPWSPVPSPYRRDEFDGDALGAEYCCVRTPVTEWWSVERSQLVMNLNKERFSDYGNPSFWGRRIDCYEFTATTRLFFSSRKSNEEAGLLAYRTREGYVALTRKGDEIIVTYKEKGQDAQVVAEVEYDQDEVYLKFEAVDGELQAYYSADDSHFTPIGEGQPLRVLGDDVNGGFNGPFIGVATSANGASSRSKARFDWFEYKPY